MKTNNEKYESFRQKQIELSNLLNESSKVISELEMNQFRDNLQALSQKVHDDTFKIMVVGTFKNGKSTFINSFLGEEVLPAYALPTTAIINEVKYGEEKRAVIHFRNPLPEKLQKSIPEKSLSHMRRYNYQNVPPLEIPYDEIENYVVIPIDNDPIQVMLESPYEKIELFWPLHLLKNGVEIIDSPGLNEHETRTKVTMEYLSKADATLFVLNAQALCSQEEMKFIENNLKMQGFEDPFFVVNRFDCIRKRERPQMIQFANLKLKSYSTNEIYFVSARDALDGKLDNDEELYKNSGMYEFEKTLSKFLTNQKGKAKLVQPSKELKRILNYEAKDKIIPMKRRMLSTSLNEVTKRYEDAKPKLEALRTKKEQIHTNLTLGIERSRSDFSRLAKSNIMDLCNKVTTWVNEYTIKTSLGFIPKEEKAQAAANEILEHITGKMEEEQLLWKQNVLTPFIQEKTSSIFGNVESDLSKFYEELDTVNVQLSGGAYNANTVPTWQRVAGVVGGLAIGDVGLAASAGINGFSKELAKTAAFEIGAGFVLSILGLLNPFTIVGVIAIAFFKNVISGESNAIKKLKGQVINDIVSNLSNSSDTQAANLTNTITNKLSEISEQVTKAMDIEINETESQVQSIIDDLEKGKENVAAKEKEINNCEISINDMCKQLDTLIFNLVEN